MEYIKKEKLNNAPIKEVMIAFAFDNIFKSSDDIKSFYDKSELKNIFAKQEETKALSIYLNNDTEITRDVLNGIKFNSADEKKELFIELDRAFYIDKNKYTGFEDFIKGFYDILKCFFDEYEKIHIKELALRYVNVFNLQSDKLSNEFYIYPCISLQNNCENFATMSNHLSVFNIQNINCAEIFATIKVAFYPINTNNLLNTVFDIDTHMLKEYTFNNIEETKEYILKLKNFENEIFFSNFKNVYEIKEFN